MDENPTVKCLKLHSYLQIDLYCDAVIIDIRTNGGGFFYTMFDLAEFFGDDRAAVGRVRWTKKDDGDTRLVKLADVKKFTSYNNVVSQDFNSFAKFYVRQNEANYGPGVVFRGTCERPKKVIVLTDNAAASAGDSFPHLFLGEELDGDLGSFTTCKIIGDIDGRVKGVQSARCPLPVSEFNNVYYSADGLPFSPIRFRTDDSTGERFNGVTKIPYNQQSNCVAPSKAPSLRGTAGGPPLPNDWESTVWQDLGLINICPGHFSKKIDKPDPVFDDRSTWRDCWLEQAILEALKEEKKCPHRCCSDRPCRST